MTTLFKNARLTASDYQFVRQMDNALLYDATMQYVAQANLAYTESLGLFIQEMTEKAKERYQLPMTGRMQQITSQGRAKNVARSGYWDVAYPLKMFGDDVSVTRVDFGYMTPTEYQAHVDGVITRAYNSVRHEILYRLFNNVQSTFSDDYLGSLTIEPLANGDSVLYPPVLGTDTEATDNHYLESGYASTAISDTNNPIRTMVAELIEHYGRRTGGIPTVTLINTAQRSAISALTNFVPFVPTAIGAGSNTDTVLAPPRPVPGEIVGYTDSSWVSVWDWMPANYMMTLHLEAPAPLKMRVDPVGTGLSDRGVVSMTGMDNTFPNAINEWTIRFGVGAGNRLNGVVMELGTGGSYTIPTDYQ